MPYNKGGKRYDRITEVVGQGECEAIGWINQNKPDNRARVSNLAALAGTLVHQKVASNELKLMSVPYKKEPLTFSRDQKQLWFKIQKDHKRTVLLNDANQYATDSQKKQTRYEELQHAASVSYSNYLAFLFDNTHTPIFVEETIYNDDYDIAGTVDLIAIFNLRGYIDSKTPHPVGERSYFIEDPDGEEFEVVVVLDWKTSKMKQKGHQTQMSGYHLMLETNGIFDRLRGKGYAIAYDTWSVLLGERIRISKKEMLATNDNPLPYQLFKYPSNSKHFLVCKTVGNNPRPLTVSLDGKTGLKGLCMVCSDILHCPDRDIFSYSPQDEDIVIPLEPFTRKELSTLVLIMRRMKNIAGNDAITALHDKIQDLHSGSKELSTTINNDEWGTSIYKEFNIFNEIDIKERLDQLSEMKLPQS